MSVTINQPNSNAGNFNDIIDKMSQSFDQSTEKMAKITMMVNEKKPEQDAAKAFRTNG